MSLQIPSKIKWPLLFFMGFFWGLQGIGTVNAQCTLTLESISQTNADCGQNNGFAQVTTLGGTAPVAFLWSTGATTQVVSALSPGVYTVTVTDASACPGIVQTIYLNNVAGPSLGTATTTAATCLSADGAISLPVSGTAPFSVSWSGAASGSQVGLTASPINIPALLAGDYTLVVTDTVGCRSFIAVTVPQGAGLAQTTSVLVAPTCAGGNNGSIRTQVTVGTLPFTFFINGTNVGTFANNINDFTGLIAGTYTIRSVDDNGCEVVSTVILDEAGATALNPADFAINNITCPAGTNGIIGAVSCPSCQLFDLGSGALLGTLATPISGLTDGAYEIRLSTGACISTLQVNLTVPNSWNFTSSSNNPACVAGNIDVTVSGATAGYNYIWSNGTTTEDLSNVAPGNYSVTVSDALGCSYQSSVQTVAACSSIDIINVTMPVNGISTVCVDTTDLPFTMVAVSDMGCSPLNNGSVTSINTTTACVQYTAGNLAGTDTLCIRICDNSGFCDTTVIIYSIFPQSDTAIIVVPAGSAVVDTCPINLQLAGTLSSVQNLGCDQVNVGGISVNPVTGCVSYTPPASLQNSGVRADTVCVRFCDVNGICDTMIYIFQNQEPFCNDFLPNTPIVQQLTDCSNITACISTIPRDSAQSGDYTFQVNGLAYAGTFGNCNEVTRIQYPVILIPACAGDYQVSWTANGVVYGPDTVTGLNGIVNFMNFNDGNTAWVLNSNGTIAVGTNANGSVNYGNLFVTCLASGSISNVGPTIQPQYSQGTMLEFATQGTYNLIVNGPLNCQDMQSIFIYCATTEQFSDTILVGGSGTFCLDVSQVPSVDTIINFCENASTSAATFVIDQANACVTYTGDSLGSDLGCFIVCSSGGACDTTYIFIDVALPAPVAQNDSLEIGFNQATGTVDVCLNDSGQSVVVSIVRQPTVGVLTLNGCSVTYTINEGLCGVDSFQYAISNSGGSDIATVYVNTACSPFIIYEGFSPNGDGINDFMVIRTIQNFPGNEVVVYNRWGNLVFRQQDYQNDWDGTFLGKDLPDGDYYLIVYGADNVIMGRTWLRIAR